MVFFVVVVVVVVLFFCFVFLFCENMFFTFYVACYVICSCRKMNQTNIKKKILSSNLSQMFFKIAALRNFAVLSIKHLCWSLFLIKLQAWRTTFLLKRRLQHRCFPVNITKSLRTDFFIVYLLFIILFQNFMWW